MERPNSPYTSIIIQKNPTIIPLVRIHNQHDEWQEHNAGGGFSVCGGIQVWFTMPEIKQGLDPMQESMTRPDDRPDSQPGFAEAESIEQARHGLQTFATLYDLYYARI